MWNLFAPAVRSVGEGTRPAVAAAAAIRLLAGGVMAVPRWLGGERIVCRAGTVWVTREGDGTDYVLTAGESFDRSGRGRVVIQALSDATVAVS
jgi:hypothetical protein